MRKTLLMIGLISIYTATQAQVKMPELFSEARKATAAREQEPILKDSLRRVYAKRWSLGFSYGQRFITGDNQASRLDTVTFADFTRSRSFYGLEVGYFITPRLQGLFSIDLLFLPRQQEVGTVSIGGANGIQVEGSGNGGLMMNLGLGAKYFFEPWPFTRPYVGLKLGSIRAIAKGASGTFTLAQGSPQDIEERSESYGYANLVGGISHRFSLGFMMDLNMGYLQASNRSNNIGGIESPGGFTTTLTLQIILNAKKN